MGRTGNYRNTHPQLHAIPTARWPQINRVEVPGNRSARRLDNIILTGIMAQLKWAILSAIATHIYRRTPFQKHDRLEPMGSMLTGIEAHVY